jgi:hypothetical protein
VYATAGQFWIFLWYAFIGVLIGGAYSLTGAAGRLFGAGRVVTAVSDVLFSLGAGALFFTLSQRASYGELRLYCFLGGAAGFTLEILTVHKYVAIFSDFVYNKLKLIRLRFKDDRKRTKEKTEVRKPWHKTGNKRIKRILGRPILKP